MCRKISQKLGRSGREVKCKVSQSKRSSRKYIYIERRREREREKEEDLFSKFGSCDCGDGNSEIHRESQHAGNSGKS